MHQLLSSEVKSCLVLLFLIPTLSVLTSLCCHYPLLKYPLTLFIFSFSLEFSPFSSYLLTQLLTGGIGKSCSLRQEHTTPRAYKNCDLGSPESVRGDAERGRHGHLKFQTNFEVGREEKDGLEDILRLFKRASSSLRERQCTFPLAQLSR